MKNILLLLCLFVAGCGVISPQRKLKPSVSRPSNKPTVEIIRGMSDVLELTFDTRPKIRTVIPIKGAEKLSANKLSCKLIKGTTKLEFTYDTMKWRKWTTGKLRYKK